MQNTFGILDPYTSSVDMPIGLSAFHTAFNLINVLVLIGFVKFLVIAAEKTVKASPDDDEETRLKFIGTALRTPELALIELQKETAHFGDIAQKMSEYTNSLINSTSEKEQKKLLKKIKKYEKITDNMEIEITEYITKLSSDEITPQTSLKLRSILNICNDLERIGDIYYQVSKSIEQKIENKYYFTPDQRNNLNLIIDKVAEAFTIMQENLNSQYETVNKNKAVLVEKEINKLRNELRKHNVERLGDSDYDVNSAMIYNNVFSSLEKVGDHIINVSESVAGEI
jgi:phosphate:Na+ symporter